MALKTLEKIALNTNKVLCTECGNEWLWSVGVDDYGTTHKYVDDVLHYWCPKCGHDVTKFE